MHDDCLQVLPELQHLLQACTASTIQVHIACCASLKQSRQTHQQLAISCFSTKRSAATAHCLDERPLSGCVYRADLEQSRQSHQQLSEKLAGVQFELDERSVQAASTLR